MMRKMPTLRGTREVLYSKLDIQRAMREQGTENLLDALLAASPVFAKDWAAATGISLRDPVVVAALQQSGIDVAPILAAIRPM